MKHFYLFLSLFLLTSSAFAQYERTITQPLDLFSPNADQAGALSNSVNLFTGEVQFPVNLMSIPGANGMTLSVNASYNSNVQRQVDLWNLEAPTGVLGLGWTFSSAAIVVDKKNTGTIMDDVHYLTSEAGSSELIYTGVTSGTRHYKSIKNLNLLITYDVSREEWKVIDENGNISIYGDETSGRNTVDWGVKWGNWIGSSNQVTGQERYARAWKLSETRNPWGAKIEYAYEIAQNKVGASSGLYHTEASYLSRIEDHQGNYIDLNYANKSTNEYQEPHTEDSTEPDAYQEIYEKKYLDYLIGYNSNNTQLQRIDLGYGSTGTGDLTKRLLTSMTRSSATGQVSLTTEYEYLSSGNRRGSLYKVTGAGGVIADYSYSTSEVTGYSDRDKQVFAPSGYAEPGVWHGSDYSVVTWRKRPNGNFSVLKQPVTIDVYSRVGDWRQYRSDIGSVEVNGGIQMYWVTMQKDFFAILTKGSSSPYFNLYIFRKDPHKSGEWNRSSYIDVNGGVWHDLLWPQLISGTDFVALGNVAGAVTGGELRTYTWRGDHWDSQLHASPGVQENYNYTGTNNWIIRHWTYGQDAVKQFYLDENKIWRSRDWTSAEIPFDTDKIDTGDIKDFTNWYAGDNMCVVLADDSREYIYRWDENFNLFSPHDMGYLDDRAVTNIVNNSSVTFQSNGQLIARRFNGVSWSVPPSTYTYSYSDNRKPSLGDDFSLFQNGILDGRRLMYNPNTNSWSYRFVTTSNKWAKIGQMGYHFFDKKVFHKNTAGQFTEIFESPSTIDKEPHFGYGRETFIAYARTNNSDIFLFKNGGGRIYTNYKTSEHINHAEESNHKFMGKQRYIGSGTFITNPSSNSYDATSIKLYKVQSDGIDDIIPHYPVTSITVNSGSTTQTTSFEYQEGGAVYDDASYGYMYGQVDVINGTDKSKGYVRNYFFNKKPDSQAGNSFPIDTNAGNSPTTHYKHLTGLSYSTKVYDGSNSVISETKNYYDVLETFLQVSNKRRAISYSPRVIKTQNWVDGITSVSETEYNAKGYPHIARTYNYDSEGNQDIIETENKYWYEVYNESTNNLLAPVVQTKSKVNGTVISSTATKWATFGGVYAPKATYVWKNKSSSNFSAWSGTPGNNWQKTSEIISRDNYGNVKESENSNGIRSATVMAFDKTLPLLSVSNARYNELFADDFNDDDITDNDPVSWYRSGPTRWTSTNFGVLQSSTTGTGIIATSALNIATNFSAEFDLRIRDHAGNLNHTGFQFNKTSQTHYPNSSGYYLKLSRSGSQIQADLMKGTTTLSSTTVNRAYSDWSRYTIRKIGSTIKVFCEGELIHSVTDNSFNGQYFGFHVDRLLSEVDNVRIYPADGYASSSSFDKEYKYAELSIGETGNHGRTLYNIENEPVATIDDRGHPVSTSAFYSSVLYNGSYVNTDPNVGHKTSISGKGLYQDFDLNYNIDDWTIGVEANKTDWAYENGRLKIISAGGGSGQPDYYKLPAELGSGRVAVEIDFTLASNANNYNIGLGIGSSSHTNSAAWLSFYGKSQVRIFTGDSWSTPVTNMKQYHTYRVKIVVNTETQKADYYLDGKLIAGNRPFNGSVSSINEISITSYARGSAGTTYVDNLVAYKQFTSSSVFTDASGRTLQSQSEYSPTEIIVTQPFYDDYGRQYAVTKPTKITARLGYRTDFASINGSGVMSGEVVTLNPDDGNYPYSRTVYEGTPLSRVIETAGPSTTFNLTSGNTNTVEYGSNSSLSIGNDLPFNQYMATRSEDVQGVISTSLTDKLGRVIEKKVGTVDGEPMEEPVFQTENLGESEQWSFTAVFDHQVTYDYHDVAGNTTSLKIGTTPGGSDIANSLFSGLGQFNAVAGQTYYFEIEVGAPGPTYYDFDCVTETSYNPLHCYDANNCRTLCSVTTPTPTVYYSFDCVTEIPYDPGHCYNAFNCRISCSDEGGGDGPTPIDPILEQQQSGFFSSQATISYAISKTTVSDQIYLTTRYQYDDKGNVTKIYPPNYFNPPVGSTASNFVTTNVYDEMGRLRNSTSPDGGTIKYVYDELNRVRFMQDANGITSGYYSYWEYDGLGRVTEEGIAYGSWNENELEDYVEGFEEWPPSRNLNFTSLRPNTDEFDVSGSYTAKEITATGDILNTEDVWLKGGSKVRLTPGFHAKQGSVLRASVVNPFSNGKEWKKRYTYGHQDDNFYNNGALVKVEVNNDTDDSPEVIETFEYGQFGEVLDHTTEIVELGAAPETVTYEYDEAGNTIGYSNNYADIDYEFDAMGRMKKVIDGATASVLAEYEYNQPNGGLSRELLNDGTITTNYTYDRVTGWLTEIEHENFFTQTLQYLGGVGQDGTSYYNGLIARTDFTYFYDAGAPMAPLTPENYYVRYRYDNAGRLKKANYTVNGSSAGEFDYGMTSQALYDANGNVLSFGLHSSLGGTRQMNYLASTNKISSVVDNSNNTAYSYDGNGNVTRTNNTGTAVNDGLQTIGYDKHLNKVNYLLPYVGDKATYGFDGSGERAYAILYDGTSSTIKETTQYIRAASEYPIIEKVTDAEGNVEVKSFVYGQNGIIAFNTSVATTEVTTYELTFESANESLERQDFGSGYDQGTKVSSTLYDHTDVGGSDQSVRLNGSADNIIGMAKSLKVRAGDEVYMEVFAKYTDPIASGDPASSVVGGIAANFTGAFGFSATEGGALYTFFNDLFAAGPLFEGDDTDDIPDAYLNYMLFDENYVLQDAGYEPISTLALEDGSCGGANGCAHQKLSHTMNVSHNGYLYIYVSNESDKLSDVFFDDLTIRHTQNPSWNYVLKDHLGSNRVTVNNQGNIEAYTDYRALGGVMRSSESQLTHYQYTGQEYDANIKLHNYRARLYDDKTGRFYAMDPQGQFHSPYTGMGNNPINLIDPTGELSFGDFMKNYTMFKPMFELKNLYDTYHSYGGGKDPTMDLAKEYGKAYAIQGAVALATAGVGAYFQSTVAPALIKGVWAGTISSTSAALIAVTAQTAAHGLIHGSAALIQGKSFGKGFATGALSSFAAGSGGSAAYKLGSAMAVGGLTAELSGGNFWDGAIVGGIVAGANHIEHEFDRSNIRASSAKMMATLLREAPFFGFNNPNPFHGAEAIYGDIGLSFVGAEGDIGGFFILIGRDKGKFFTYEEIAGGFAVDAGIGSELGRIDATGNPSEFSHRDLYGYRTKFWGSIPVAPLFSIGGASAWSTVGNRTITATSIQFSFGPSPLPGLGGYNYGEVK